MVSRFVRPQEWTEDTIGHKAEKCLLRLLARLGVKADKGTDFEDLHFGADLWVRFRGQLIPVQLTCESDRDRRGLKVQKAEKYGVAFVHITFFDVSRSMSYQTAAKRVMDSLREQLDQYLSLRGAPTLTREGCYQSELNWVSRNGNTFQPQRRAV